MEVMAWMRRHPARRRWHGDGMAMRPARRPARGFLFTMDALIAGMLLIGALVLLAKTSQHESDTSQISSESKDLLQSLSAMRISDLNDPWVASMVKSGAIADPNASVLEQIGYFWALGDNADAQNLSAILLRPARRQFGIDLTIDGTAVYSSNGTGPGNDVAVDTRMVSGIAQGQAITGSSASAYLRHISKEDSVFIPFGGFFGEGNITVAAPALPSDANVTDIIVELDIEQQFDLLINGNLCDHLVPTPTPLVPTYWSRANCSSLLRKNDTTNDTNDISIRFNGPLNTSSIDGGYIKIVYRTSTLQDAQGANSDPRLIYPFPRIDGLINLYDGFFIAGNVSGINVTLHFNSSYPTYLTIGNASIITGTSDGRAPIVYNDSQLLSALTAAGLSYTDLSRETVPVRFGIGDVLITGAPADTVVVTDTSGSMVWCTNQTENDCSTNCGCGPCSSGGGTCGSQYCGIYATCAPNDLHKIDAAKNATSNLVTYLLNSSGTRVGLSEFASDIKSWYALTANSTPLISQINTYNAVGGTCICCGINNATSILNAGGQILYIQRGSAGWKYNDSNLASPPAGWNTSGFNDLGWRNGTTAMGWGYGGLSTLIAHRYQGDYYSRKSFNVNDSSLIFDAKLYVYSDDGADVYLNGARIDHDYGSVHNALYWNRNGIAINKSVFVSGQNVLAVRQYHRGTSTNKMGFDLEIVANTKGNTTATQRKNIVLMTDGQTNVQCAQQGTGSAIQDAIKAACDAYTNYGIVTYTVGFGRDADAITLQSIANCTTGSYYPAANFSDLTAAFGSIANTIIQNSHTQIAITQGNVTQTTLYPDSDIMANFTPDVTPPQPNELTVTVQSPPLANCSATIPIYAGRRILDAEISSYSGQYWTSLVSVNNNVIYNLSKYSIIYESLGDPFMIHIPVGLLPTGNDTIIQALDLDGTNSSNLTGVCSSNNTLIYTIGVNLSTDRSAVVAGQVGCNWTVAFSDGTNQSLLIPQSYNGTNRCSYVPGNISYDATDAYQIGAYTIFDKLDLRRDGTVFVNLGAEDLEVIVTTISRIPYMWGPSIVTLAVTR